MMTGAIYEQPIPRPLKLLGARWRDGKRSFRMKWGEISFGRPRMALQLCLFGDRPHYSLNIEALRINLWIRLPFLERWAREPEDIMESWGASYTAEAGGLHLRWGRKYKIITMPWHDWQHISHMVRRPGGDWVPYVGSWEHDKKPDGRAEERHPYFYLLQSGEVQQRTATIHVERRIWRLRWLRWTSLFQKVRHSIDVEFDGEVGERTGSWKGGTIGCGYDLKPGETPLQCLRRMQAERRFT
jgi:hypothetical protein